MRLVAYAVCVLPQGDGFITNKQAVEQWAISTPSDMFTTPLTEWVGPFVRMEQGKAQVRGAPVKFGHPCLLCLDEPTQGMPGAPQMAALCCTSKPQGGARQNHTMLSTPLASRRGSQNCLTLRLLLCVVCSDASIRPRPPHLPHVSDRGGG